LLPALTAVQLPERRFRFHAPLVETNGKILPGVRRPRL